MKLQNIDLQKKKKSENPLFDKRAKDVNTLLQCVEPRFRKTLLQRTR